MGKRLILFVLLVILLISLSIISAIEITINPEFKSGETIQLKISGNFLNPILKDDILFYRSHVKVPFNFDLEQIEEEYYISATQEKETGNYSIEIRDAQFWRGSELVEEDIIIPFKIINETADFSIDKGYIFTNEDFYIRVQNLAEKKLAITALSNSQEKNISLKSGDIAKINFDASDFEKNTIEIIEISSGALKYQIPVYIFWEELEEEKETGLKLVIDSDESDYLNISMPTNSSIERIIYLYNSGDKTITNITLSLSNSMKGFVSLSAYEIDELEANSSVKIEMQIDSPNENYSIQGQLKTKTFTDFYKYIPISINFIKGYEPKSGEYGENTTAPGKLIAPGDLINDTNTETGSSTGKVIGWTILILVLIFLAWFFLKKYRGAKNPLTAFDRAVGK